VDQTWTKPHVADRIVAHADGFGACPTAASAGASRCRVDRVVGEALQMDGGRLTGMLKLLKVVSDRRSPAGTGPAIYTGTGTGGHGRRLAGSGGGDGY
jgi:hypothetical protein